MNLKNVLLIICLAFISEGYSWWDEGHSLICNKAANLMSAETSTKLFSILESDNYGEGCVWPDVIKQVERRETGPWHYINSPPGIDEITPETCPEKGCIMSAYEEQLSLLRNGNDTEKKDSVRFIGHFIADVHQPLHAGFGYDRGGNDHLLTLQGKKKSNMHSIWDGEILEFLYKTKMYASLTYSDMPFILSPNLFSKIRKPQETPLKERMHKDGIKINLKSPEAFDDVFFQTFDKNEIQENILLKRLNLFY